jgi:NMD protein affecting ribosome stability and mRNA decay
MKVVDALWIWTEPHSMRLKIRVTVRAMVEGVELQQRIPVEWKIHFLQCNACNREYSNRVSTIVQYSTVQYIVHCTAVNELVDVHFIY